MGARLICARMVGAAATWTLRHLLHRPAANTPGKVGLAIDPQLIADLAPRLREGSVVVVGTNGKTTVTNLLADAFEAAGKTIACNRTGANLGSGVASALLHTRVADWGVIECDELWLAKVAPQLAPRYIVLLNLFRDQLDRMGEIDHLQQSIEAALAGSPQTTLVYNCDDPLCQAIADRVGNATIPFGVEGGLHLAQNTVADASICQRCDGVLEYAWRQYGQLGSYHCPTCGFRRPEPAFAAADVELAADALAFNVRGGRACAHVSARVPGTYMLYNLLAVCVAADCCGLPMEAVAQAIAGFSPNNGRLQHYEIGGKDILLNLAKNPTGLNQNLRIIEADPGACAVAIFINDKEADGHDVSWLWDVDLQELAAKPNLTAFAGGLRRNDMQVRLKYAGLDAQLVDDATDFIAKALGANPDARLYVITNYTALAPIKAELDRLKALPEPIVAPAPQHAPAPASACHERLVIAHLYPELLNLYGDGGNVTILERRARARGIDVEVVRVGYGQTADFERADIVFLGGGPDREQRVASRELLRQADALRAYVEDDGVLLAICGGYQILGREWLMGGETVPGLGVLRITTMRAEGGSHNRLVGNIKLTSSLATMPVIGYENHAGRTFLDPGVEPFGLVVGHAGKGNNDDSGADGVRYRNVVGTYLHGPLLSKNPEVADWLIAAALTRRAQKNGLEPPTLAPLDDAIERAANERM